MRGKKRIMVCVTQQKSCQRLIDYGANLRMFENDDLHVVHVVKENWKYFGQLKETDALEYLFDVSKVHGASLTVLKAKDIEGTLAHFAENEGITHIVMGESLEITAQQNMINRLQEKTTKNVRFEIVQLEQENKEPA